MPALVLRDMLFFCMFIVVCVKFSNRLMPFSFDVMLLFCMRIWVPPEMEIPWVLPVMVLFFISMEPFKILVPFSELNWIVQSWIFSWPFSRNIPFIPYSIVHFVSVDSCEG